MNTCDPEFRRTFKPLFMAIHLLIESQVWLLKFVAETSPTLSDFQKHAIVGQIESVRGVLEIVRQHLDEPLPPPEA